jgi:hypothetical protein
MTDQPENPTPEVAIPVAPKKRLGWPKGKKRKLHPRIAEPQRIAAAPGREPTRDESLRTTNRRIPLEQRTWEGDYEAGGSSVDRLNVPRSDIPDGFDLTWVTNTVLGKPEPDRMKAFEKGGWETVHATDFQGKFKGRWTDKAHEGPIEFNGLTLCARPLALSQKSRARDLKEAKEAVLIKEQQLRGGELKGVSLDAQHQTAIGSNKINRTMEKVTVPAD